MPIEFKQATLDNGLTIIAECDEDAHSAAAGFFVKTGARDEPGELMGVSHFLEHMMFKGTEELSAEQINRGFDELGARNNAYTSHELTVFYGQVLPEHLEEMASLLGRMMRPALRQDDFDTEKNVILEEIAMYRDEPFWVLYEATGEHHYRGHPLGHRVLGTPETIGPLERDRMAEYFRRRYSADNTTLALAGKLDFDRVVDLAQGTCGRWERAGAARDNARPGGAERAFELRDKRVSRAYMLGLAPAPAMEDPRRYSAFIAAQLLGGSDNSRLHWSLIETGLAEEAQASYTPHDGTGEFLIFATGDPSRAEEIWEKVRAEAARLAETATDDDLERIRSRLATGITVGSEKPGDRMQRLGRLWTYLGEYVPLDEELARIESVTLADLRETLAEFPPVPATSGRLLPGHGD